MRDARARKATGPKPQQHNKHHQQHNSQEHTDNITVHL